eukprot:CAMPEP_0176427668 /NCGR_PEP_ID=MMETSP0127-20121128/12701_1 /TAXON_ID=938130 /ORGANISM="Platyophrya macrostoma, Strain WH" /LENGTH=127 /DNA_ID=CAMNT_0017809223 /DNA_START=116 /DNA_END=499 /DNA_ORIENTATION=+
MTSEESTLDLTQLVQRKIEILQQHREAKKDLEGDMRSACEEIIQSIGQSVVEAIQRSSSGSSQMGAFMQSADFMLSKFIVHEATRGVLLRPIQGFVLNAVQMNAPPVSDATKESDPLNPTSEPAPGI